jgi:hypothetical protein
VILDFGQKVRFNLMVCVDEFIQKLFIQKRPADRVLLLLAERKEHHVPEGKIFHCSG